MPTKPKPKKSGSPKREGGVEAPPIATARRHVQEFERRVERQREIIERLENDKRLHDLVVDAQMVLSTLEYSLRVARDHLALECDLHGTGAGNESTRTRRGMSMRLMPTGKVVCDAELETGGAVE